MTESHNQAPVLYAAIAIGAYWSWTLTAMIGAYLDTGSTAIPLWLTSVVTNALVAGACGTFALRGLPASFSTLGPVAAAATCVGSALIVVGGVNRLDALAQVGAVASGAGSALLAITLISLLGGLKDLSERYWALLGASLIALTVPIMVSNLPAFLGNAVILALPFLAAWFGTKLKHELDMRPASVPDTRAPQPVKARDTISAPLLLCALLFSFAASLYKSTSAELSQSQVFSLALLITVLVALVFLAASHRVRFSISALVYMPLMAGGMMLFPFLMPENAYASGALIYASKMLFNAFFFAALAETAAKAGGHAVFAVACGIFANDMGHLAGSLLGDAMLGFPNRAIIGICLAVAYVLVILVSLLLFPGRINRRFLSVYPMVSSAESDRGDDGLPGVDSMVTLGVAKYGLTPREGEVLRYLLQGRTLPAIAGKLSISYNTVKTHVNHIYQKTGVNAREGLIDLFEQQAA